MYYITFMRYLQETKKKFFNYYEYIFLYNIHTSKYRLIAEKKTTSIGYTRSGSYRIPGWLFLYEYSTFATTNPLKT